LKILTVNASDALGGAARASYRLHQGLNRIGVQSQMLVQKSSVFSDQIIAPDNNFKKLAALARAKLDYWPLKLYPHKTKTLFSPAWLPYSGFYKMVEESEPDILHLHWIANGMVRIEDLAKIKKPIVWTMHDMWPFTGGCHNDEGCGKYKSRCKSCPVLDSQNQFDLSSLVFKRKEKVYRTISNLRIIGPSLWLTKCAQESILFRGHSVTNIPNPIDTNLYRPMEKNYARDLLNLPKGSKIILFGAASIDDPNKNFALLVELLEQMNMMDVDLIVFGSKRPDVTRDAKLRIKYLGPLYEDLSMRILYNAADLVVVPSFQENLSNVILESMSCGIPVAAFNIGGNPDIIEHKTCGYLAKPYDLKDLACGIQWILDNINQKSLAEHARQKIINCFDVELVSSQYRKLYREILDGA